MSEQIKFWKISALLLLGLFTFFYILTTTLTDVYYVITNPVAGFNPGYNSQMKQVVVNSIVPNGPADKAGLRAGDEILMVNEKRITHPSLIKEIFESFRVGDVLNLTIRRNNENIEKVSFTAERHVFVYAKTVLLRLLPGLIFCYALCIIGTFVFLKQIHQQSAYIFYLMVLFWAIAMMRFVFSLGDPNNLFPPLVDLVVVPSLPLAAGLMLNFYLIFPIKKQFFIRYRSPILFGAYAPAAVTLALLAQMYIQYGAATQTYPNTWWIGLAALLFASFAALGHSIWKAPNPYARKQAQIIAVGTTVGLGIPTLFYFLPRALYNSFEHGESILLLTLLWPISLAYAIVKHRFMNIDVIIRRGVAYAIMSGFVILAYFILVVGMGQILFYLLGTQSQIIIIIATLLIAVGFDPVRRRVMNFLDRRFFPAKYGYRDALRHFSHELTSVVDLQTLLNMLVKFLSDNIGIRPIVLLWVNPEEKNYFIRDAVGLSVNFSNTISDQSTVIQELYKKRRLLDFTAFKQKPTANLTDEIKAWTDLETEIVLPLFSRSTLMGALALGQKGENEPYYKEDVELLETLSDHIQIAIENAVLTDELREQERLKKELEVARRIQLSLLPQHDPVIAGLDVSGISIPAMEVGGDYYDYLTFDDGQFGIVVADVSGKGTSAALYMSQLKGMLKALTRHNHSLSLIAAELNTLTFANLETKSFITLMLASFDLKKQKMHLVRAGHLPLLHYNAREKKIRQITPKGIGIGLDDGAIFQNEIEELALKFSPGDGFLFLTDGIVEANNSNGEELDFEKLHDLLEETVCNSAKHCRENIIKQVRQFSNGAPQRDDMTLVVVRIPE